jgi:tRNA nucleotidyltransferase (CCA-adding enzyme)
LYDTIFFNIPAEVKSRISKPFTLRPDDGLAAISILHALLNSGGSRPFSLHSSLQIDPTFKARLYLAAILTPFLGIEYQDHKEKDRPLVEAVIRDSLKLGTQNHYLDGIPALFAATRLIKPGIVDESQRSLDRVRLGLLLRDKLIHNPNTGSHWTSSLLFTLVTELVPLYDLENDSMDSKTGYLFCMRSTSSLIQSISS